MKDITDIFKNAKVDFDKLAAFGFAKENDVYIYQKEILKGQFVLKITINSAGRVLSELIDTETGDEYIIHLLPNATGAFVGKIRQEYQTILDDIKAKCFESQIFKQPQINEIIKYIKDTYQDELEFLWEKFPEDAIVRRKDNKKWYIVFLTVKANKLGLASDEKLEIIDIRVTTEELEKRIDNQTYFPGYHMNKKSWLTIRLDENISLKEVFQLIDKSYALAKK